MRNLDDEPGSIPAPPVRIQPAPVGEAHQRSDGKFDNPDKETVEWLVKARKGDSYRIHMTNGKMVNPNTNRDVGAEVTEVLKGADMLKSTVFRKDSDLSVRVDLFDELPV